jgi:error-prone DNA polymerase
VLWQELARRQRKQWLKAQLLQVKGVLEIEGDVIHIVAGDLRDLTGQLPNAQVKSRDFH